MMKRAEKIKICRSVILVVLCFCIGFVGCDAKKGKDKDDSFGKEFVPVMAGIQSTTATQKPQKPQNPSGKKRVAITYDDGPHTSRTIAIVDELNKYGYHATFFVVGNRVDGTEYNGGQAMLYAIDSGNEIAIHGYTHTADYAKCSDQTYNYELSETVKAIRKVKPGYTPTLMRPIWGSITGARVNSCPYSVILWNVDSLDWENAKLGEEGVQNIVNNVMSSVKDGDIILMHDIHANTYEATKIILKQLYDEGYEVVTVSELLGDSLKPGAKYSKLG